MGTDLASWVLTLCYILIPLPQATWGHQALGMAPTAIQQLKRRVGVDSHMWHSGGCMTTCLAMEIGQHADPEMAIPTQLFHSYLELIPVLKKQGMALEQIWRAKFYKLRGKYRWQSVTSMIDAIIATLFDLGWRPHWPWKWISDIGDWWSMDVQDPLLPAQLMEELRRSISRRLHRKMASHCHGQGAEDGVDFTCLRRYIQKHKNNNNSGRAKAIGQGAIWDYARQASAKQPPCTPTCQHCGQAAADWHHQVYVCPFTLQSKVKDINDTNYLCPEATANDAAQCLYLRGLVPATWNTVEPPPDLPAVDRGGAFRLLQPGDYGYMPLTWLDPSGDGRLELPPQAYGGTDGSGGSHGKDPRIRRCSWSLIVCAIDGTPFAWQSGPLPGRQQTVPRAELHALVQAFACTKGDLILTTDSEYVFKGYHRGPRWRHASNADLWSQLWSAYASRTGKFQLFWGPSHELQSSLASGTQLPWQAYVNDLADHLAEKAAKACQVTDTEVFHLHRLDEKALDIIKRLVAVHELYSAKSIDDQVAPHHNFLPLNPIITNLHGGSGSSSDDRENILTNPSFTRLQSGSEQGSSEARIHSLPNSDSAGSSSSDLPVPSHTKTLVLKADRIKHLLENTAHRAVKEGTLYKCTKCFTKCIIAGAGIEEWLKAPCTRTKPSWMHSSHLYKFSEPLHYCQKCGFHAKAGGQANPALVKECSKPTIRGKANLAQFAKGKLPQSFKP